MAGSLTNIPILSILIFIPVAGAVLLLFLPSSGKDTLRGAALGAAVLNFFVSLALLADFDPGTHAMQFTERLSWIPAIGVEYHLGMDGISLLLVLLTTFITVVAVLCSWTAVEERVKEYMLYMLLLEAGMVGVFVSLDLILFFLFWEVGLIPMYMLIGIWGGARKLYANIKFFLYTLFGSVFMLVGILALYYAHGAATGEYTFDLLRLYETSYAYALQWWVFLAFFLGFAIKVPVFPFHTWLPDAHVEAPTAGSVILAGVLLKMGTYGFLRFNLPLLPEASVAFTPFVLALAVIGVIYGAFLALAQKDIKKLVAYSSVSHLGVVMAGIFAMNRQGIDGGVLQMINHGVSTGGLFLVIGMIYERRHTRRIEEFGGLVKVIPVFAFFTIAIALSSIALPGTNGFIGEVLILAGLFKSNPVAGALVAVGGVLGPIYMLGMCRRVIYGALDKPENKALKDLDAREVITLVPVLALILLIGLYPKPFLNYIGASTSHIVETVERRQAKAEPADAPTALEPGAVAALDAGGRPGDYDR